MDWCVVAGLAISPPQMHCPKSCSLGRFLFTTVLQRCPREDFSAAAVHSHVVTTYCAERPANQACVFPYQRSPWSCRYTLGKEGSVAGVGTEQWTFGPLLYVFRPPWGNRGCITPFDDELLLCTSTSWQYSIHNEQLRSHENVWPMVKCSGSTKANIGHKLLSQKQNSCLWMVTGLHSKILRDCGQLIYRGHQSLQKSIPICHQHPSTIVLGPSSVLGPIQS
jgi:hypothetical protein